MVLLAEFGSMVGVVPAMLSEVVMVGFAFVTVRTKLPVLAPLLESPL
jgi:hypothetical protein